MRGIFAVLIASVLACASDPPVAEGEPCVFCGGSGGFYPGCVSRTIGTCKSGLTCLSGTGQTNTCERLRAAGETCDPRVPCAEDLICHADNVCKPPSGSGGTCGRLEDCGTGLLCNFGGDTTRIYRGQCTAWEVGPGEPCFWAPNYGSGSSTFGGLLQYGCPADLFCVPSDERATYSVAGGVSPELGAC